MKKILVVDDNPDLLYVVKLGLERIDETYKVSEVNGGKECFELLRKGDMPDIILLDIMMPEMNGWKVLKRLKENERLENIPVIIISARKDKVAKNAGGFYAEDYIEKPFTINDVKETINKIL